MKVLRRPSAHATRWPRWRRERSLVAAVAIVMVVSNDGHGPDVNTFNSCLGHKPFLATTVRRSNGRVIDTISDRASGEVVGKSAMFLTSRAAKAYTFLHSLSSLPPCVSARRRMQASSGLRVAMPVSHVARGRAAPSACPPRRGAR